MYLVPDSSTIVPNIGTISNIGALERIRTSTVLCTTDSKSVPCCQFGYKRILILVGAIGFEPMNSSVSEKCIHQTMLHTHLILVRVTGFEPAYAVKPWTQTKRGAVPQHSDINFGTSPRLRSPYLRFGISCDTDFTSDVFILEQRVGLSPHLPPYSGRFSC